MSCLLWIKPSDRSRAVDKKRILFVINTLGRAGAERALLDLLRALPAEWEIDLYVLLGQGELIGELPERVQLLNRQFDPTPIHGREGEKHLRGYVLRTLFYRAALLRTFPYILKNGWQMLKSKSLKKDKLLWRTLAVSGMKLDQEYDLAVSYIEGGAAYYVSERIRAKKKAAFIHVDIREAGYTRELDGDCYAHFDRIFAVSEEVRRTFCDVYPEYADKTEVFRNILDLQGIEEKSLAGEGFLDGFTGKRILSVGRLNRQKAFEVSIEAMELLKRKTNLSVRWYVLGEGDERAMLEHEIEKRGLTEDFILLGNVSNPYPYMRQCDIYAHCSRFEGKSIAIGEARTLGKPIVVTDTPGNREQLIHMTSGLLVDFSAEAIAEALQTLLEDEKLSARLGREAKSSMLLEYADNDIPKLEELV